MIFKKQQNLATLYLNSGGLKTRSVLPERRGNHRSGRPERKAETVFVLASGFIGRFCASWGKSEMGWLCEQ